MLLIPNFYWAREELSFARHLPLAALAKFGCGHGPCCVKAWGSTESTEALVLVVAKPHYTTCYPNFLEGG